MNLLLLNGMIYDGTGSKPFHGDIRVRGDRIEEIGERLKAENGEEVIDVSGMMITPGFVDMHRHCDKSPFEAPRGKDSYGTVLLRQGITSTVTGNCGISMYPLNPDAAIVKEMQDYYLPVLGDISSFTKFKDYETYRECLENAILPVNTAAMIGMGAIRISVKGFDPSPFTAEEIGKCQRIVRDAMEKGAPGVSVGLMYLPECYETAEELGEILKPVGEYGGIVTAHIRGEGDSLVKSVQEIAEIGRIAGCRVEISHMKSCGVKNWNREIFRAIRVLEDAKAGGLEADCDFYPYNAGSTTLMSMIPPAFAAGNIPAMLERLKTEEGREKLREMLKRTWPEWDNYAISLGWDKAVIATVSCPENKGMIGLTVPEIVGKYGFRDETEAVSHILVSENGSAAIIIRSMDPKDVDTVAALPYSAVISDAIYAETDNPHPRMYGAFPHFLKNFAFERKIIPAETAIHKMTQMPAERMRIKLRGVLKEGYFADINVFDPDRFTDKASYTDSAVPAEGLSLCLVNGEIAVKNDSVLREDLGRAIRF